MPYRYILIKRILPTVPIKDLLSAIDKYNSKNMKYNTKYLRFIYKNNNTIYLELNSTIHLDNPYLAIRDLSLEIMKLGYTPIFIPNENRYGILRATN